MALTEAHCGASSSPGREEPILRPVNRTSSSRDLVLWGVEMAAGAAFLVALFGYMLPFVNPVYFTGPSRFSRPR